MKKKDIFIQDDVTSCGARCIQSVVSYYGGYVPLETVLEDTNTSKTGTTALDLVKTLEKYGFNSYGLKISLEEINSLKFPVIAHTINKGYEHFLVIYEIKDGKVLTMDPEFGEKTYKFDDFKSIFDNIIITLNPFTEIPKYQKSNSILKLFIPILKKTKVNIIIIIFLSIITLLINITLSLHLKVLTAETFNPIYVTSLFIILRILANFITFIKEMTLEKAVKIIDEKSVIKFITHIFKLPQQYLNSKRVGEMLKKIEDMTFLKDLFIRISIVNSLDIFSIFVSLIPLVLLSKKLMLINLSILLIYIFIIVFSQKKIYQRETKSLLSYNNYSGTLVEYLEGIESIKNLNSSSTFLKDIDCSLKKYTSARYKKNLLISIFMLNKDFIFQVGLIIMNLIGYLSINNNFTLIDLITYTSIHSILFASFENIMTTFNYYLKGKAIFRNICEFNDVKEEKSEPDFKEKIKLVKFHNLTYSYDYLHNILKDFNYSFKIGDKILLTGPSGVGKSTLVKCLSGRINKYAGSIFINTNDIKTISIDSLREKIVYIGQEENLFRKSIVENITLDFYDEAKFKRVCELALVDEIIRKKSDKENSMILEGATNISGGEKSRMILARALYKNPKILIIDETLSTVSEDMENKILDKLLSIENMSLIYITHRNKENKFKTIIKFRKDGTYEIKR